MMRSAALLVTRRFSVPMLLTSLGQRCARRSKIAAAGVGLEIASALGEEDGKTFVPQPLNTSVSAPLHLQQPRRPDTWPLPLTGKYQLHPARQRHIAAFPIYKAILIRAGSPGDGVVHAFLQRECCKLPEIRIRPGGFDAARLQLGHFDRVEQAQIAAARLRGEYLHGCASLPVVEARR